MSDERPHAARPEGAADTRADATVPVRGEPLQERPADMPAPDPDAWLDPEARWRRSVQRTNQSLIQQSQELGDSLASLASAVRTPEENAVATIERGLRLLHAFTGITMRLRTGARELEAAGAAGHSADLLTHWQRIPIDARDPLAEVARSGK